ncbi:hypothetical protein H2O64_07205 [Kordia sp. YSTF-M3]|uniref:Bacteriocin n=1 Tax=Kordia aestuariivivens TaxID=2759037 RepID=A0ABR7Q7C4_9FLAO|nr:class I lanthipeptide [Kordia aestuariivivens]MBC8754454.1 hypothetical protein [Kordia aestuariivivens]
MKTQKIKSLKLVKESIASLDSKQKHEIKGGGRSFTTICITSCVVH